MSKHTKDTLHFSLSNGVQITSIGLDTWKGKETFQVKQMINCALINQYTHIDTAAIYGNEGIIGETLKSIDIPREKLFITTKLWVTNLGYASAEKAFLESLKLLQLDYIKLSCATVLNVK